jgi:DNA repair exonuclease SbcCD ATPase subunit
MSSPPLHFTTVTVRRLYGIDHDLRVETWCEGVNVVYGPNASGKTTLARALRGLLWPTTLSDTASRQVAGQFKSRGARWHVDVDGTRVQHQKNGTPSDPPSLPPPEHHTRYHLYLHHLLAATEGPDAFAERIMQEAVGGYDVKAAADALGFEVVRRRGGQRKERVEQTRDALDDVRSTQQDLRQDHRRLDRLRDELADARAAQTRAEALRQAVAVADARQAHREAQARADAFPDALDNMQGTEHERLRELQAEREEAAARRDAAEADLQDATETISESRLPEDGLPDGFLTRLRTAVRALDDDEDDVADATAAHAEARREEDEAWDRLALGTDREAAAAIDLPALHAIETHVERVESVRGRLQGLDTIDQMLSDDEDDVPPVHVIRDSMQVLIRWLQVPVPVDAGWGPFVVMGLGAFATIAGGALLVAQGTATVGGLLLVGLGLVTISTGFSLHGRGADSGEEMRALHRQEFGQMDVDDPFAWTRESVVQRMRTLANDWARAVFEERKADERDRLRIEREELHRTHDTLADERESLADRIGLSPDTTGSRTLRWIVERLSRWQTLHEKRAATAEAVEAAEAHGQDRRDAVAELVAPYGVDAIDDAAHSHGVLSALDDAQQTLRDARQRQRDAQRRRDDAQAEQEKAESAIEALYRDLGLDVGDRATLTQWCEQYDDYQEAVAAAREAATRLATKREHLQALPGYDPSMDGTSPDVLRSQRDEAASRAAEADDLFAEIERIEQRIENARAGRDLETAYAAYREARDALARKRRRDVAAAAGSVLADHLQQRTRDRDLPDVFRRARTLFADVTTGRYELHLDRDRRVFRATDHTTGRTMTLDALSSGTKVQLLLCVRVAFVEHQEEDVRLPLVLDETLANSDDAKADAIIDAVCTIAGRDRQIVYLTAQQDEVAKWEARLADDPLAYQRIPLADAEMPAAPGGNGAAATPVRPDVPTIPSDLTAHADVPHAIDVPAWTPRQPVEAVHLWYLIEDVDLLRRALDRGLARWGPWSFLTGTPQSPDAAGLDVSEDGLQRIAARAQAVAAWKKAWRTGRGRPVDRAALEATDAVSDRFLDAVTRLADSRNGNAGPILNALRGGAVQYFRTDKVDALDVFFREHGYLDPADPLPPETLWQHVLAAVGPALDEDVLTPDGLDRLFARFRHRADDTVAPERTAASND